MPDNGALWVFEGETRVVGDIDVLLDDGWKYMQGNFVTWKSVELEDFSLGENTKFNSSLALDPKFHLIYLKHIQSPTNRAVSSIQLICLDWKKKQRKINNTWGKPILICKSYS
ncbi:hypothetical protein DFH28DRAFT_970001 [Melampsora americana]|nr:hypothetical protein DFH28DRAFT_970001 [Melampsora americana]